MWKYGRKKINKIEQMPEGAFGFIYLIRNIDRGLLYIGKKNLYFERKTKLTKKELEELTNKRNSKFKVKTLESDWLNYNGSSKDLLEHISQGDKIEKVILEFCFSKRELTYKEVKYLFLNEVLEKNEYYNSNIMSKFFKGNIG